MVITISFLKNNNQIFLGITHDCVCIVGVKIPTVLSRRAGRFRGRTYTQSWLKLIYVSERDEWQHAMNSCVLQAFPSWLS